MYIHIYTHTYNSYIYIDIYIYSIYVVYIVYIYIYICVYIYIYIYLFAYNISDILQSVNGSRQSLDTLDRAFCAKPPYHKTNKVAPYHNFLRIVFLQIFLSYNFA